MSRPSVLVINNLRMRALKLAMRGRSHEHDISVLEEYNNVLPVVAMAWIVDLEIVVIYVGAPAVVAFVAHVHVGLGQVVGGAAFPVEVKTANPSLRLPEPSIAATL